MKSEQGVYPVSKVTYIIRSTAFQRAQYIYVHPTETQSQWSAESLTSQCRKVASIQHKCKHSAAKLRLHNRLTLFLSISPLFFFFFFKKYHERVTKSFQAHTLQVQEPPPSYQQSGGHQRPKRCTTPAAPV